MHAHIIIIIIIGARWTYSNEILASLCVCVFKLGKGNMCAVALHAASGISAWMDLETAVYLEELRFLLSLIIIIIIGCNQLSAKKQSSLSAVDRIMNERMNE